MRVSTVGTKKVVVPAYKSKRLTYRQRLANVRQLMARFQMVGAEKGTQFPGQLIVDDFTYSTDIFEINESQTITKLIETHNDSFFDIISRQIFFTGSIDTSLLEIEVFDAASDRLLLQRTPLQNFAGTGKLPHSSIQIKTLSPTQRLRINFMRGSDGEGLATCQLSLTGRKVFINDY